MSIRTIFVKKQCGWFIFRTFGSWSRLWPFHTKSFALLVCLLKPAVRSNGVYSPANRRTGHGRNNTRSQSTQETGPSELALNDSSSIEQPSRSANFLVRGQASSLQKCLDHVEWCRNCSCHGTSKTSRNTMGEWIILLRWVHNFRYWLVSDKLSGGKGDGHAEGGRVRDVESLEAFHSIDCSGTLRKRLVDGTVDLHALFDDCSN